MHAHAHAHAHAGGRRRTRALDTSRRRGACPRMPRRALCSARGCRARTPAVSTHTHSSAHVRVNSARTHLLQPHQRGLRRAHALPHANKTARPRHAPARACVRGSGECSCACVDPRRAPEARGRRSPSWWPAHRAPPQPRCRPCTRARPALATSPALAEATPLQVNAF